MKSLRFESQENGSNFCMYSTIFSFLHCKVERLIYLFILFRESHLTITNVKIIEFDHFSHFQWFLCFFQVPWVLKKNIFNLSKEYFESDGHDNAKISEDWVISWDQCHQGCLLTALHHDLMDTTYCRRINVFLNLWRRISHLEFLQFCKKIRSKRNSGVCFQLGITKFI